MTIELSMPAFDEREGARSRTPSPITAGPRGRRHITLNMLEREDETRNVCALVDKYYHAVRTQLLRYQSLTTGLFPRTSRHGDLSVGYVRDTIYCAWACFTLSKAYKRMDDDRGRSYELGQSAVKSMRGILMCWLKQAQLLEAFKNDPCPANALHSKFDITTGAPIVDHANYGHLQIDVVALYLLTLVQFTAGGLSIIFSKIEASLFALLLTLLS